MDFSVICDHNALIGFYRENGLEVSDDIKREDGAVFSIGCFENGDIISAATLSLRFGVYILDYVAVKSAARGKGLGERAVALIAKKAKDMGADRIYITAKNPHFFEKIGFLDGSPDGVDMNADCIGCPELHNGCEKKPMYLEMNW